MARFAQAVSRTVLCWLLWWVPIYCFIVAEGVLLSGAPKAPVSQAFAAFQALS